MSIKRPAPNPYALDPMDKVMPPKTIVVYTDGGASPNPGHAGLGVVLIYEGNILDLWEYMGQSTNNIAELTAIWRALEQIKNKAIPVLLYSDSAYAIGVLTGRMKAVKNRELIASVQEEMRKFSALSLLKVKAHIGITYNERVDRLVAKARETRASGSERSTLKTKQYLQNDES